MMNTKLGFLSIAFMYVGAIMGAGFASGREIWQFFGVFGKLGYLGVGLVCVLFMIIGFMTSRIACILNTEDMGRVIVPGDNWFLKSFVAYFLAIVLFMVFTFMSAAGGALFSQQFGQSEKLGGAVIVSLAIITVIGGFSRLSKAFRFVVPVLMTTVVFISVIVIIKNSGMPVTVETFKPSPLAGSWHLAAFLYLSLNVLAVIPIISKASIQAKSNRHAYFGSVLGGFFVGMLAFILFHAMRTEPGFSNSMDMPMLAFSEKLSPAANLTYTFVLLFAIYATATMTFYASTTKLIKGSHEKLKIFITAWAGFAMGLVGFSRIVEYVYPIIGFLGISIVVMLTVNFILLVIKERKTQKTTNEYSVKTIW